ncbi:MAG TPA: DUF3606 domain-containing protein [Chitinophagaceae bacterium]|nr:DUF3606 domain-containing protein [Chitinophagaceae bacterium]
MNTKQKSSRGRAQDRAKVAGGQDYEVSYEAKKTGNSSSDIKQAVKAGGNSRKAVEKQLKK